MPDDPRFNAVVAEYHAAERAARETLNRMGEAATPAEEAATLAAHLTASAAFTLALIRLERASRGVYLRRPA
jgi:hypothetical protein